MVLFISRVRVIPSRFADEAITGNIRKIMFNRNTIILAHMTNSPLLKGYSVHFTLTLPINYEVAINFIFYQKN